MKKNVLFLVTLDFRAKLNHGFPSNPVGRFNPLLSRSD